MGIPVGWWIAEPPTEVPSEYAKTASTAYTNRDKGYTKDGFVSGGVVYLEKLLKLLKQAGMHAYLDMHALPGGAVKQMGYRQVLQRGPILRRLTPVVKRWQHQLAPSRQQ